MYYYCFFCAGDWDGVFIASSVGTCRNMGKQKLNAFFNIIFSGGGGGGQRGGVD